MIYHSTAIITKEKKWFVARSAELGVTTQGKTVEEAKANLQEAVELYLEDAPQQRKFLSRQVPLITSISIGG